MNATIKESGGSSSSSTISQIPGSLKEFHLLEKLPIELRLDIWKLALPEARIIEIVFNKKHKKNKKAKFQSRTSTPAIVHACPESRLVGLQFYNKLIVTKSFLRTYVRWDQDTIFMDPTCKYALLGMTDDMKDGEQDFRRKCHKLALMQHDICHFYAKKFAWGTHFPNLKELLLVQESVNE